MASFPSPPGFHLPQLTPSERVGTTVAQRYDLSRIIGQGSSAVLFAGRDRALDREVVVKVMRPDGALSGAAERERFRLEALTLARLRYPNLVEVYDVGETSDGVPFVVMELLRGESLAERLARTPSIAADEALAIVLPLMGALACVHEVGVIHRDVKPANVFLQSSGAGSFVPKLLDFGIAKADMHQGLTSSGLALGTPAYMAPELARGEGLGPQTDVWAVGVMLFRMLSGRLPFEGNTAAGVLWNATQGGSLSLVTQAPHVDRALAVSVERALVPDLSRRHADMRAFAESLTRTARRAGIALPPSSSLAGLPGYARWCDATDAEIGTARHEVTRTPERNVATSPAKPMPSRVTRSEPEPTQATQSQASVTGRSQRVKQLSLGTLIALGLLLAGWGWLSTSRATPNPDGSREHSTSLPPTTEGTASIAIPAATEAAAPAMLPALSQGPDGGAPVVEPKRGPRPRARPKSPAPSPSAPATAPTPARNASIVTDFEW